MIEIDVQAQTIYTQAEEEILMTFNQETPTLEQLEKALECEENVFHFSRTASGLLNHWLHLRMYAFAPLLSIASFFHFNSEMKDFIIPTHINTLILITLRS